jgi:hypothetical protein
MKIPEPQNTIASAIDAKMTDDGPRIVDADEVDEEVDEVDDENTDVLGGYRDLNDREVDALLSELEHGTPKLRRQAKLQSMLGLHGRDNIRKLVLLTDASSSVTGFEQLGTDFVNEMVKRGMRLSTTAEFLQ